MINPIHAIMETCYLLTVICIHKGQFPFFRGSIYLSIFVFSVLIKLSSYKIKNDIEYSRDTYGKYSCILWGLITVQIFLEQRLRRANDGIIEKTLSTHLELRERTLGFGNYQSGGPLGPQVCGWNFTMLHNESRSP